MIFFFRVSWRMLVMMIVVGIMLLLNIIHHKARAQPLPPEDQRTATWYSNHVPFMRRMLNACRDDPGHGTRLPDCVNAKHGEMIEAERIDRARLNLPVLLSPNDTRFWVRHADMLPSRLLYCSHMSAEDQAHQWCAAAREADRQARVRSAGQ